MTITRYILVAIILLSSLQSHAMMTLGARFFVRGSSRHFAYSICTRTGEKMWCELVPKQGYSMDDCKKLAAVKLQDFIHDDPEPGATWGSCQATAAAGIFDVHATNECDIPLATLARYLLSVDEEGFSPRPKLLRERIEEVSLVGENQQSPSQRECKAIMESLQKFLREDIASKVGADLRESNGETRLSDPITAFEKSIALVCALKPRILLAIYPGSPTLSEVRSFIGAEYIIPFAFNEKQQSYVLDASDTITQIRGDAQRVVQADNSLSLSGGRLSIIKKRKDQIMAAAESDDEFPLIKEIPMVRPPSPNEVFFVLHAGFSQQNDNIIDSDFGNIISRLNLESLDPIKFASERFFMMQRDLDSISRSDIEKIDHSHLSLYHFSHIKGFKPELFKQLDIHVPNSVVINRDLAFTPKNKRHHPLLVQENISDYFEDLPEQGINIIKAENGIRYFFRALTPRNGELDLDRSYLKVQQFEVDEFIDIEDEDLKINKAIKFLNTLSVYHNIGFCLRTRLQLKECGLTAVMLQTLKSPINIKKLFSQAPKQSHTMEQWCKFHAKPIVMKNVAGNIDPFLMGTTVVFFDQNKFYYTLRIVFANNNEIDLNNSFVLIERFREKLPAYPWGGRIRVNDERVSLERARKFLNILALYMDPSFEPSIKEELESAGISRSTICELSYHLRNLLSATGGVGQTNMEFMFFDIPPDFVFHAKDPLNMHDDLGTYISKVIDGYRFILRIADSDSAEPTIKLDSSYLHVAKIDGEKGLILSVNHGDAAKHAAIFLDWLIQVHEQKLCNTSQKYLNQLGLSKDMLAVLKDTYLKRILIY